jgi:hypothetical protein
LGGAIFTLDAPTLRNVTYASDLVFGGVGTPPNCPEGTFTVGCPGAGGAAATDGNVTPSSGGSGGIGGTAFRAGKTGAAGARGALGELALAARAGAFGQLGTVGMVGQGTVQIGS